MKKGARYEAMQKGEKHYVSETPCKRGHVALRNVKDKTCSKCQTETKHKFRKENPAYCNHITAKYRSDKALRTPKWLTLEQHQQIKAIYYMAKELEIVFPWKQHVDHVIPLRGNIVSGFHHPDNLQILSEKMNMDKHNTYEVA